MFTAFGTIPLLSLYLSIGRATVGVLFFFRLYLTFTFFPSLLTVEVEVLEPVLIEELLDEKLSFTEATEWLIDDRV